MALKATKLMREAEKQPLTAEGLLKARNLYDEAYKHCTKHGRWRTAATARRLRGMAEVALMKAKKGK